MEKTIPNKNDLAYWYPILQRSGVLTPRTQIVMWPGTGSDNLMAMLDGHQIPSFAPFVAQLEAAVHEIGLPCFLRNGHGSDKHSWDQTCFIEAVKDLPSHVFALVEWLGMIDLWTDTWAVREYLPTKPVFYAFRGTPICREFRVFYVKGRVQCIHPYWPDAAIYNPSRPDWKDLLKDISQLACPEKKMLCELTGQALQEFDGDWSIDWLWIEEKGWYAIDMADAERSYHWEGCPHAPCKEDRLSSGVEEKYILLGGGASSAS